MLLLPYAGLPVFLHHIATKSDLVPKGQKDKPLLIILK